MKKDWRVLEPAIPVEDVLFVAAPSSGFGSVSHPVLKTMLANRGVTNEELAKDFLEPDWERGIHDPFLFSQMPAAVARIFKALEKGEHITVHGDYDADGVSGSAVIITTLRELAKHLCHPREDGDLAMSAEPGEPDSRLRGNDTLIIDSYIPHRDKEGYGLNPTSVATLHERGTNLIITVDCGIANVNEIAQARELGMDVIVVDHHQFGDTLPNGILIHPKIPGEHYPFPHLAAVGVSFKLACALVKSARERGLPIAEGWEKWLLDFVSIATITDMVPLVGENRVLETYGLRVMNKTRRPGLQRLIQLAGYELGKVDSQTIGFGLGPRINAAGRMDHASLALNLLLAETEEEASMYGEQLETQNKLRQKATAKMMDEAAQQEMNPTSPLIVFWSEQWSPALVGLVAGKYMEKHGKPVVAIGKHGERWIGSGRSFAAYDITEAMRRAGDGILTRVGGHIQACGFSFDDDSLLQALVERLHADACEKLKLEECVPILNIEAEVQLSDLNWQLIDIIRQFEPYGEGNRRPTFMTRDLEVVSSDLMGQTQKHLRCLLRSSRGEIMKFVAFNFADRLAEFAPGALVDVAYDVDVNEWNGRKEIQCKLVDVRAAGV
jgi:single-stranded-DNA-specific exonuclease